MYGMSVCVPPNDEEFYYDIYDSNPYYYRYEDVARTCNNDELNVEVITNSDDSPTENKWTIETSNQTTILENIPYHDESYYGVRQMCLDASTCHRFTYFDEGGDGHDTSVNIYALFFLIVDSQFVLADIPGDHSDLDPNAVDDDYYKALAGMPEAYSSRTALFGNCDVVFDATGLISHQSTTIKVPVGDRCWQFDLFQGGRIIGSRGPNDCVGPLGDTRLISRFGGPCVDEHCLNYIKFTNGNGWEGELRIKIDPSVSGLVVDESNADTTQFSDDKIFYLEITVNSL